MDDVQELKRGVESQQGGTATFVESAAVKETFEGKTVWEGVVHVFDLDGHPGAMRTYAWFTPVEGSAKRQFFAVLHLGFIRSPQDAVRAAIMAEHRAKRAN